MYIPSLLWRRQSLNSLTEATMEEIRLIEQLADITPDTVFKPNYWAKRRYYWGYSPVGDDGDNNFWCYG